MTRAREKRLDDDLAGIISGLIEHYTAERQGDVTPLRYAELTGRLEALQEILGWLLQRRDGEE